MTSLFWQSLDGRRYPRDVIKFNNFEQLKNGCYSKHYHPTQKPVALLKYLIKTYTDENEVVFDPFSGVASTAIACKVSNRRFIGFELDKNFFDIGQRRLSEEIDIII